MESAASGILAGKKSGAAPCRAKRRCCCLPTAMLGALSRYISDESIVDFQPMGANMGVLPPLARACSGQDGCAMKKSPNGVWVPCGHTCKREPG